MIVLTTGKNNLCNKVMAAHNKHERELLDIFDLFLARFFRSVERVKLTMGTATKINDNLAAARYEPKQPHTRQMPANTGETASVPQVVVWAAHEAESLNHGKVRNLGKWPKDEIKISATDRTGERNWTLAPLKNLLFINTTCDVGWNLHPKMVEFSNVLLPNKRACSW